MKVYVKPDKPSHKTVAAEADRLLWEKFKAGDTKSFAAIYDTHIHTLYFYGLNISGNAALTEDCIQDLFIYLWDSRKNLGGTDNIKYYLFKSLRRKILLEISTYNKNKCTEKENARQPVEFPYEHKLITEQVNLAEKQTVNRAIGALTKRQQEAIRLRFYDNLSFKEIADTMSLTMKSTYNLISRALDVLRGQIHNFPALLLLSFLF